MTRLQILEYPDPRLRLPSAPVTEFDDDLGRLIDDLLETLTASKAIGLAAPQANDRRAVLVIDPSGSGSARQVYVNPEILRESTPGLVEESCLSVPGVVGNVIRATEVRVRARNRSGEAFERDLSGMDAVCLQHEMDHLAGRLFVDRLSWFRRWRIRAAARRRQRAA
ncbi:MAG: peptide deformylase [Myxococcota bacterium]|nr:peptide deformylase [Myxococcota bacterium]